MKADYRVQEDVVEELAADPSVDASGVGVTVKSGIVALSGTVPSYAAKLAAEQAAARLAGVRAVALELTIDVPIARANRCRYRRHGPAARLRAHYDGEGKVRNVRR